MKSTVISIIIAVVLIGGAFMLTKGGSTDSPEPSVNNVSVIEGKQVIEISAKGGYSPRITTAQADLPTVLKMNTTGTYDCSIALTIPSIGYRKYLPPSGVTEIEVPAQKAGTKMQGICSMGMYSFTVNFI